MASACAVEPIEDDISTTDQPWTNTCDTMSGINPVKAALAVAMAQELGSIEPLRFFAWQGGHPQWDNYSKLTLSGEANNICNQNGGCPNLASVLGLQGPDVNRYIDQSVLNVTSLRFDLFYSFQRQWEHTMTLVRNAPYRLPEPHQVRLIGTVDRGACGLHYEFEARKPGTSIPLNNPQNLAANLVFFGGEGNSFLAFYATDGEIGIDPTAGLNGSLQQSGTCGSGFSVYDPTWWSYGKCCAYSGRYGTWAVAPWAANTFYCKVR